MAVPPAQAAPTAEPVQPSAEAVPMRATPQDTETPGADTTGSFDLPEPPPLLVEALSAEGASTPAQASGDASTPVEATEAGTPAPAFPPTPEERPLPAMAMGEDADISTGTVAPKAAQRRPVRRAAPRRETRRVAVPRPAAPERAEAGRAEDSRADTTGSVGAPAEVPQQAVPRMRKEPLDGTSGFVDGPIRPLLQ